jgi:hypothetical protein
MEIKEYLNKNEYSYRRLQQCALLQLQHPEVWNRTIEHRKREKEEIKNLSSEKLIKYVKEGYNPERLINSLLMNEKILKDYGKCMEVSGSLWAFLGSALYKVSTTTENE